MLQSRSSFLAVTATTTLLTLSAGTAAQLTSISSQSGVYEVATTGLTNGSLAYTGNTDSDASRWTNVPAELEGISYALTNSGNATTDPLTVTAMVDGPTTFYVFHSDRSVDPDLLDMDDVDGRPQWLLDEYVDTGLDIGLTNGLPNGGIETFSIFSVDLTESTSAIDTFLNDPSTGGSFSMYGIAAVGDPIPEPTSIALLGLASLATLRRRRA
jgi:hypothetical protein